VLITILRKNERGRSVHGSTFRRTGTPGDGLSFLEARMTLRRDKRVAELAALIDTAGIQIVPADLAQIDFAFEASLRFGKGWHPAGLNLVISSLTRWLVRRTSYRLTKARISDRRTGGWLDRTPRPLVKARRCSSNQSMNPSHETRANFCPYFTLPIKLIFERNHVSPTWSSK
jgi:hypothetical protein